MIAPEAVGLGAAFVALATLFNTAGWGHGDDRALVLIAMLVLTMVSAKVRGRPGGVASGPLRAVLPWLAMALALVPAIDGFASIRGVHHMRVFDGFETALVLFTAGLSAAYPDVLETRRGKLMAVLGLVGALLVPAANLVSGLVVPKLLDIGTTTADAARAVATGLNPYVLRLDTVGAALVHDARFGGFKYLPAMPLLYLPFVRTLGDPGILVLNGLLWAGMAVAVLLLSRRLSGACRPMVVVLLACTPVVAVESLALGATDVAPMLVLLGAFLAWGRSDWLAGLLVGLSLSMKLTPAILALPLFVPSRVPGAVRYGAGILVGLLPVVPYLAWAPRAMFDNVVVFNIIRVPDLSSWRFHAPGWTGPAAIGAAALVWGGFGLWCVLGRVGLAGRLYALVAVVIVVLLSASSSHDNYSIWWMPLLALLVGVQGAPIVVRPAVPGSASARV